MPRLLLAGFEPADEPAVRRLFEALAAPGWALADDPLAEAVLIDLDSMSGQMAWMKGLAPGQVSIGLTRALRAPTDHRLEAPLDAAALAATLARVAETLGDAPVPANRDASPPAGSIAAEAARAAPPAAPGLADWIDRADGAFAVQVEGLPRVVVDPAGQRFAPGRSLKALLPYARAGVPGSALQRLEGSELDAAMAASGDPQPLGRLLWVLALGRGEGQLLGHPPERRFQLGKWPQVEREFPRHFRIATVLLKAPGTVAEVAAASGASEAEVADYLNAALAAGHAEVR